MKPTRATDDFLATAEDDGFIVRKSPLALQIFAMFSIAFVIIFLTASMANDDGGKWLFLLVLAVIIGLLGWFTGVYTTRHRDLVLATEFMNAMLASAAQLSTRFCLITRRDGSIVYIDSGFQKLFPTFMQRTRRTVDALFASVGLPKEITQRILGGLRHNHNDRFVATLQDESGKTIRMMITVDVLPRPMGYFLFRGRDYVENRNAKKNEVELAQASLLAQALYTLPMGVIIVSGAGKITYANHILEEWLGYGLGDLLSFTFEEVCIEYAGKPSAEQELQDYTGPVTLLRKNGKRLSATLRQTLLREGDTVIGASAVFTDSGDRKKMSAPALQDHASPLSGFIAASPIAVAHLDAQGIVLECNQRLRELATLPMPQKGWKFTEILSEEDRPKVGALIARVGAGAPAEKKPLEIMLGPDKAIIASLYLSRIAGEPSGLIAQVIDTTEQKNLEQRFAHSQKMQAVGQLAGGVAHDFNNLLTAMIGFCDLLLMRHPAGDQSFADIMQIKQNANRAANLVRQLLAFSRRQTLQPKMIDVTDVLAELSNLVRRLIGENIELKLIHGRDLGLVKADQGQLEQVFINLAVNARDAMPGGGQLTIQTSHTRIDKAHPIAEELVPPVEDEAIIDGKYVLVEVIDTGTGIPHDLLQKIFEPFFSTKEVGSGTGLGLATVYGIVKQTGGYIYVSSEEGKGTRFCLFFPRHEPEVAKATVETVERPTTDDLTGKGTVLLVEDEAPVRTFAARALRNKGYTVLEADCGETALEIMGKQGNEVDVIITDVIMPGINGPEMIEQLAPQFPKVRVIFISGYAEDVFVKSYGTEREFNFLPKPFTLKQLASKVKEVIQK